VHVRKNREFEGLSIHILVIILLNLQIESRFMFRVKIYGAGSIGNHLAYAARHLGWNVVVSDISPEALERMRLQIYPDRYGQWDNGIDLCLNQDAPMGDFDLIFIGTPPDLHLDLALQALQEKPRAVIIEKPLCTPSLDRTQEFYQVVLSSDSRVFVGYNHVVATATRKVEELLSNNTIGHIESIYVDFREHWQGIFQAHSWLKGPEDSYLGYWERGGGASGEHSHAINLWQHFAQYAGAGKVKEVNAMLDYVSDGKAWYDKTCLIELKTETGLIGQVVQDVVSIPFRKVARIQGEGGSIEWVCGYDAEGDAVIESHRDSEELFYHFPKRRPDDFIEEMKHIDDVLRKNLPSPFAMGLEQGLDTMLVLAAAHRSEAENARIWIDYEQGYIPSAINISSKSQR